MRAIRNSWRPDEDRILIDRRASGDTPKTIGNALARTAISCKARLQWHGASTIADAKRVQAANGYSRRFQEEPRVRNVVDPELCPSIIAARDAHLEAMHSRNLTATLCGDPPPGRSALDASLERTR